MPPTQRFVTRDQGVLQLWRWNPSASGENASSPAFVQDCAAFPCSDRDFSFSADGTVLAFSDATGSVVNVLRFETPPVYQKSAAATEQSHDNEPDETILWAPAGEPTIVPPPNVVLTSIPIPQPPGRNVKPVVSVSPRGTYITVYQNVPPAPGDAEVAPWPNVRFFAASTGSQIACWRIRGHSTAPVVVMESELWMVRRRPDGDGPAASSGLEILSVASLLGASSDPPTPPLALGEGILGAVSDKEFSIKSRTKGAVAGAIVCFQKPKAARSEIGSAAPTLSRAEMLAGARAESAAVKLAGGDKNPRPEATLRLWFIDSKTGPTSKAKLEAPLGCADEAEFYWNHSGTHLLVSATTNEGAGSSYYGLHVLYLVDASDPSSQKVMEISLGGGNNFATAWSPVANEFVVIYGSMPEPATTLFNAKGQPLCHFPRVTRNTIMWSPNGRFLAFLGLAGLSGAIDIWDRSSAIPGAKGSAVPQASPGAFVSSSVHAHVVSVSWSPDSMAILLSATKPRNQLDNGFRILKINGVICGSETYQTLYQSSWQPVRHDAFPNVKAPLAPASASQIPGTQETNKDEPSAGVWRPKSSGEASAAASAAINRKLEAQGNVSMFSSGVVAGGSSRAFGDPVGSEPRVSSGPPGSEIVEKSKPPRRRKN